MPPDPDPHDGDGSGLTDGLRLSYTNPQNEQLVLKIQPRKRGRLRAHALQSTFRCYNSRSIGGAKRVFIISAGYVDERKGIPAVEMRRSGSTQGTALHPDTRDESPCGRSRPEMEWKSSYLRHTASAIARLLYGSW